MVLAIIMEDGRIACPQCKVPPRMDGYSRHVGDCPGCGQMVVITEEVLHAVQQRPKQE